MWLNRIFRQIFPKMDRNSTFPLGAWLKKLAAGPGGGTFPITGRTTNSEGVPNDLDSYAERFYKSSGVVYGVCRVRRNVFSQIYFKWKPKDAEFTEFSLVPLKGVAANLLDKPAPGTTMTSFLSKAIQDIDLMGNAYWYRDYDRVNGREFLRRLRPDWVDILLSGDPTKDAFVDVIGYAYYPGGDFANMRTFFPEEVVHWMHEPDPQAQYRGMSWMTPVIRDILIEEYANEHRLGFFKRGAQSNVAIVLRSDRHYTPEQLDEIQARFRAGHSGYANAYEPMFVANGADIVPIESDLSSLDMKNVSGRAETHIAMASGVHPTVGAMMEGMQGASLNSGNYKVAERAFVNITMHPLWQSLCEALEAVVTPPRPTKKHPDELQLWYSVSGVSILNDDRMEREELKNKAAETMDKLVREGWTSDSVKEYIKTGNTDALVHTGALSVQLYYPMVGGDPNSNLAPGGKQETPTGNKDDPAPPSNPIPQPNTDPKSGQANPDASGTSE